MAIVGLISHSGAAQDVRRLTSLARTIDVHERVNVAARILAGVAATPDVCVRYLDEPTRVVERALAMLAAQGGGKSLDAWPVGPLGARDAAGTRASSAALVAAGAGCVVTHGGDGTNRAVVRGWPDAVLVPLPGGTNNAFARCVDPTAAGLAAGLYATEPERFAANVGAATSLSIAVDGYAVETAIVDVALLSDEWVGARAIWDPARLVEAVVVNGDPSVPGLAGVAGMLAPTNGGHPTAVHLRFGSPGRWILAPLGPGQLVPLCVRDCRVLGRGETIELSGPGTLAFDGEREVVLRDTEPAHIRIATGGVRVLDVAGLLRDNAVREATLDIRSRQTTTQGGP
jgi:hypothetical protein